MISKGPRPGPVTVIKPDGSSTVLSPHELRNRLPEDDELASPFSLAELQNQLEEQAMKTLLKTMREGTDHRERTAAATAAVKYLAIKYRIGPVFGEDLDEP